MRAAAYPDRGNGVPVVRTVYGALLNDAATLARLASSFHEPPYKNPPVAPVLYIKPRNTFAGEGAIVPVPSTPGLVRIDATVGAVIGRTATRVARADALEYIAGYVIASDLTLPHDSCYRPAIRLRGRDGFCPMSAVLSPPGFDLSVAMITVAVNDVQVHRRHFADLVRDLPRLVAEVTAFITLDAGDVLLLGPPDHAPLARAGDTVRIDVPGLGTLAHSLVDEA
jgi:5-oxopent-3-ene-1,2,5-tricarboxylate decarboxylase/2-hydroxyhepta-2,4-diene-1,7-dioate isomerase